jgi:DNA-directed RNA polymerase specialized sigma24 family protein
MSRHDSQPTSERLPSIPASQHDAHGARPTTPDSSWDFELTPALDARLNALALAGRDDPAARNALHALLAGKIARFLAPWCGRRFALGDFADLRQESFLVYADLVADWSGEGSFARFFLGFFPWRLRHAIEARERRWPADRLLIVPDHALLAADPGAEDAPDPLLPFWPLSDEDRRFLLLRLRGHTIEEAARLLGLPRRTGFRRWRALVARLGPGGAGAGPQRRAS